MHKAVHYLLQSAQLKAGVAVVFGQLDVQFLLYARLQIRHVDVELAELQFFFTAAMPNTILMLAWRASYPSISIFRARCQFGHPASRATARERLRGAGKPVVQFLYDGRYLLMGAALTNLL